MKLHMHNNTTVIHIQYKFHEIPSIGYLVMAEDGETDGRKDGQCQTYIHPPSAGDIYLSKWKGKRIIYTLKITLFS